MMKGAWSLYDKYEHWILEFRAADARVPGSASGCAAEMVPNAYPKLTPQIKAQGACALTCAVRLSGVAGRNDGLCKQVC